MLVDNAIVIVEKHLPPDAGGMPERAALRTNEVAWPVITSTVTTLAAFVPMLFWRASWGVHEVPSITLILTLIPPFVAW
jgi:multidrug efflux pump subunit AcrB